MAEGRKVPARILAAILALAVLGIAVTAFAAPVVGDDVIYTTDADFDKGTLVNVNHDTPNQLQLNETTSTFPRIFIATTNRSTVTRIDTNTGQILGEYRSIPDPFFGNTSRTTVALDGTAWAGNRDNGGIVHIGNPEANQCVDRNGNGTIETSTGYGDVKPWPDAADFTNSSVASAVDECILHFRRTATTVVRHVSVNADNDVWVSGVGGANESVFQLVDGDDGTVLRTEGPFACGGYGGLIDQDGVLWSASSGFRNGKILRFDPDLPASSAQCVGPANYGMAVDNDNNIWTTELCGPIHQLNNATGADVPGSPYPTHSNTGCQQGLAIGPNNHVWVSSSLFGGTVLQHFLNDGTFIGNVTGVGSGSTGVAVDSNGKVWTANISSSDATRIDPNAGPVGADGVTKVGAVDLTVPLPGAGPYNYSDMTGSVLLGTTAPQGTWTVVQDGGEAGEQWGLVDWTQSNTKGTITAEARAADTEAGLGGQPFTPIDDNIVFNKVGRFIEVRVTLKPDADGTSPVMSDIRISTEAPPTEGPPNDPTCFDLTDNDGDGNTDLSDPDCQTPEGPFGSASCSDGVDNDGDGDIDSADEGCDDPGPNGNSCGGKPATIIENGNVVGTNGPDVILTGNGPDTVDGRGGDDYICTRGGEDNVRGGAGADRVWGGRENDHVRGSAGDDLVFGGRGDDDVGGQAGDDTVLGYLGNDKVQGADGEDFVRGQEDNDTLNGGPEADRLFGNDGRDLLAGNSGAPDLCNGGPDIDKLAKTHGCEVIVDVP